MADVFISYSKEDRDVALLYRAALASKGVSVWWDDNLLAGDVWQDELEKQLHEASCVLVLWSGRSAKSNFVQSEVAAAKEDGRLVPALVEPLETLNLPQEFLAIQATDMTGWAGDPDSLEFERLLGKVRDAITRNRFKKRDRNASVEFEYFKAIRPSTDPDDWADYIKRFPKGDFVDVARKKMIQLEEDRERERRKSAASDKAPAQAPVAVQQKTSPLILASALLSPVLIVAWLATQFGPQALSAIQSLSGPEEVEVVEDSLTQRKANMLAAIETFGSGGFSDSEARTAIAAASALTKDEIESDQEILQAVETTLDSFFGADRFDFAAQLEEAHAPLFREHAEFYVSFCLAYGLRILEQSPRTSSDLWSVDDRGYFNRNVEKYKEYAQLDVVRQRFPEYEAMYEPFIMRLEGASDAAIIEKMRAVDRLNGGDLNNFSRTMERYATGAHAVNPNRRDAVLVRQRIQSLIRDFHEEDPSGNWRRLGVLSGMDL
ncbi:MAG: toll/interleukin-1 receptor domain-containing protein [Pseudomonadota bacterium]